MTVRYNRRAKEWNNETIAFFSKAKFNLENTHEAFEPYTETSGSHYPIRDSCAKKGDPSEGCLNTNAYMYKAYMDTPSSSMVDITIRSENNTVVKSSYHLQKVKYYTRSELGCTKDS